MSFVSPKYWAIKLPFLAVRSALQLVSALAARHARHATRQAIAIVLLEYWVGVCGALLETLTLFQTKICDFPYPISDLTQNFDMLFQTRPYRPHLVCVNIWEGLQIPNVNQTSVLWSAPPFELVGRTLAGDRTFSFRATFSWVTIGLYEESTGFTLCTRGFSRVLLRSNTRH